MSTKILDAQTSDTLSSGASFTGAFVVHVSGTLDGARVQLVAADDVDTAQFDPIDFISVFTAPGWKHIAMEGAGTVKANLIGSGASTSVTVTVVN